MLGFIITFLKTYFHVYILLDDDKTTMALWVGYMGKIMCKKEELWDKKH
jgi:hypothetical protein